MKIYCVISKMGYYYEYIEYCCYLKEQALNEIEKWNRTRKPYQYRRILKEVDLI